MMECAAAVSSPTHEECAAAVRHVRGRRRRFRLRSVAARSAGHRGRFVSPTRKSCAAVPAEPDATANALPGSASDTSCLGPPRSASTGFFFQEFLALPGYPGATPNGVEAFSAVPAEGLVQILFFMGWLEVIGNKGKYSMSNM